MQRKNTAFAQRVKDKQVMFKQITGMQELDDNTIVDFCNKIGVKLLPCEKFVMPRFRLSLSKINFGLLISKALFIQKEYGGYMEKYESRKVRNQRRREEEEKEELKEKDSDYSHEIID